MCIGLLLINVRTPDFTHELDTGYTASARMA